MNGPLNRVVIRYSPSTRVLNYSNRTSLPRSEWRWWPDGWAAGARRRALVSFHHCSFSGRRRRQRRHTTLYRDLLYIDTSTTVLCRAPAGKPNGTVPVLQVKVVVDDDVGYQKWPQWRHRPTSNVTWPDADGFPTTVYWEKTSMKFYRYVNWTLRQWISVRLQDISTFWWAGQIMAKGHIARLISILS